ncbi:uncharacterized protein K489DRAFT_312352 [Dissoconium aciculare CBS 342.82]|uniref:Integral membrane protein n=1 Tax=Dissoconium aciculare CBS 342.82 TaxID=1314786 RepID=A0A6J3MFB9_9PEZI|nr:uncharacterized protein K489DRAFT_312352 [Dissoconium aciculare CBS 342.82]KAF1826670.1 hypothetical protein K489DRAFT_312352 [Dissoconium aciculare CBS 342.82]
MTVATRIGRFVRESPQRAALLAYIFWVVLTLLYLRSASARDSTSLFFDEKHGYDPIYTRHRMKQAEQFINQANNGAPAHVGSSIPFLAVGIVTIQRDSHRYFRLTVGSILEGLRDKERGEIRLLNMIADVNPQKHQAYNESWLHTLSDKVLTYQDADVPSELRDRMAELEVSDHSHVFKPMLDYIHLMRACYATGAPYIALLEDDVLAADGWYHRTLAALDQLHAQQKLDDTVYLRLFYNSGLLGWNSERWLEHLMASVFIAVCVATTMYILQRNSRTCSKFLTTRTFFVILFVCTPCTIGLYYAAGRLTTSPLSRGVVLMDSHGCCSQAFVFPRNRVPDLIKYYESRGSGLIDQMTEIYANERGLHRYALVPSVFQHIGGVSSKGDDTDGGKSMKYSAAHRWNFDFELFDPLELEREHAAALKGSKAG